MRGTPGASSTPSNRGSLGPGPETHLAALAFLRCSASLDTHTSIFVLILVMSVPLFSASAFASSSSACGRRHLAHSLGVAGLTSLDAWKCHEDSQQPTRCARH